MAEMSDEEFMAQQEAIYQQQAQMAALNSGGNVPYSAAMFGGQQKQNLVEWQLDFRNELEDIERLLRSDVLTRDKVTGQEVWITNPNKSAIILNDLGVSDVIREIRMFLNKNKVLSWYQLDEIKPRVQMLSHELRALIYNNYEMYGIEYEDEYKMNNYPIVVLTIASMIEDAYRRALNGGERRDLNQARIVQQTEPMGGNPMGGGYYPQQHSGSKKKWYNPLSWMG